MFSAPDGQRIRQLCCMMLPIFARGHLDLAKLRLSHSQTLPTTFGIISAGRAAMVERYARPRQWMHFPNRSSPNSEYPELKDGTRGENLVNVPRCVPKGVTHVTGPRCRLLIGWWPRLFPASFISPIQIILASFRLSTRLRTAYVAIISGLLRISDQPSRLDDAGVAGLPAELAVLYHFRFCSTSPAASESPS